MSTFNLKITQLMHFNLAQHVCVCAFWGEPRKCPLRFTSV